MAYQSKYLRPEDVFGSEHRLSDEEIDKMIESGECSFTRLVKIPPYELVRWMEAGEILHLNFNGTSDDLMEFIRKAHESESASSELEF